MWTDNCWLVLGVGIHQVVLGCFRGLCRLGYSVAASTIYCRVCCLGHCCLLVFQKAIEAATGAGVEAEEMMVVAPIKADYSEARW